MCACTSNLNVPGANTPVAQERAVQPITQTPIGEIKSIEIKYLYKDDGTVQIYPTLNGHYPGSGDGDYNPAWFRMAFQCGASNSAGSCQKMSVGSYWATVVEKPYDQYIISMFVAESAVPFTVVAFSLPKR